MENKVIPERLELIMGWFDEIEFELNEPKVQLSADFHTWQELELNLAEIKVLRHYFKDFQIRAANLKYADDIERKRLTLHIDHREDYATRFQSKLNSFYWKVA